jgi:hypothetical protein
MGVMQRPYDWISNRRATTSLVTYWADSIMLFSASRRRSVAFDAPMHKNAAVVSR